jgi:repressor LexA
MNESLTPTEDKIFQYLIEFLAANSYQPSIREIGRQFEIKSTKTVSDVLGSLARKGYIQRNQSRSRGLRILTASGSPTRSVPFFATLAEFGPPTTLDRRSDVVLMDRRIAASEGAFLVRASDDAMAECGVRRADMVLVDPNVPLRTGDLVAVRVGCDAAVRIFESRDGVISAHAGAAHADMIPINGMSDEALLGAVCGVFRGALSVDDPEVALVAAD